MKRLALTLTAFCFAPAAFATGLLVPAYFYPSAGSDWSMLDAASSKVDLTAIVNPDSGPMPGPADPNYSAAISALRAAGGQDVGYIYTGYGATPIATVESQISTYLSQYPMSGFFFDAMSGSPVEHSYYQTLYDYVKGLNPSYTVIDNPGTSVDQSDAASPVANTFIEYEGPGAGYPAATPPAWTASYPASMFAVSIYGVPTVSGMLADLALASSRNVGSVYITDQGLPNPYDQLPSYWDQEVAAIQSMPEPQPFAVFGLGLGGLIVARKRSASTARR